MDCLTYLCVESDGRGAVRSGKHGAASSIASLPALRETPASVVLVSNEVGSGVVPASDPAAVFRDALGELNQRVAAIADNVVLMVAGLPLAIKGTLASTGAQVTR